MTKPNWPKKSSFLSAAWMLGCTTPAIEALAIVEAGPKLAFLETGEPTILYEPHVFSRLTKGKFDGARVEGTTPGQKWGDLSYPDWRPGRYGSYSVQHKRLAEAAKLSRSNALKSCSWGLFQVLGENHRRCGFGSIQDFVNAMYDSVEEQMRVFVAYCWYDRELVLALRRREAATIARLYNGPGYRKNKYDEKWKREFDRLTRLEVKDDEEGWIRVNRMR